jgi:hypothetical protein
MAGPQSSAPKPVLTPRPNRRFTLAQANSALPLVKRIVADIVKAHGDAATAQAALEKIPAGKRKHAQAELESRLEKLEDLVDELTEVGCELKDYRLGLIDFVGRHRGRDVYLCWKLGEEAIGYWHELGSGFGGRQPVSTLRENG